MCDICGSSSVLASERYYKKMREDGRARREDVRDSQAEWGADDSHPFYGRLLGDNVYDSQTEQPPHGEMAPVVSE